MADELVEYDAIDLGRLVRKCEISPIRQSQFYLNLNLLF